MPDEIYTELAELCADTVVVQTYLTSDIEGQASYGSTRTLIARVIGRTRLVLGSDGVEQVSNVQVVFPGPVGVTAQDLFTLPVRFSADPNNPSNLRARQPQAIAVDRESDENGAHHETVYFSTGRLRGY